MPKNDLRRSFLESSAFDSRERLPGRVSRVAVDVHVQEGLSASSELNRVRGSPRARSMAARGLVRLVVDPPAAVGFDVDGHEVAHDLLVPPCGRAIPRTAEKVLAVGAEAVPGTVGEHVVRVEDHLVALDVVPEVGLRGVEGAEPPGAPPEPEPVGGVDGSDVLVTSDEDLGQQAQVALEL